MNLNFILFALIPFILMSIISIGMPFWRIRLMKEAGEKLLPLVRKRVKLQLFSIPLAYLLLILSNLINFGKLSFVIPYCAVLALFITIKESTLLPVNGLYENLIINGSTVLKYKDIADLDSKAAEDSNIITVTTRQNRTIQLIFDNSNEADEVRRVLLETIKKSAS